MSSEVKQLQALSQINRSVYQSKQVQQHQVSDRAQEQNATFLGYDMTTGQFRVKDDTGKIFYVRAITNSGELSIGSRVSLVIPASGIPVIDAMPR